MPDTHAFLLEGRRAGQTIVKFGLLRRRGITNSWKTESFISTLRNNRWIDVPAGRFEVDEIELLAQDAGQSRTLKSTQTGLLTVEFSPRENYRPANPDERPANFHPATISFELEQPFLHDLERSPARVEMGWALPLLADPQPDNQQYTLRVAWRTGVGGEPLFFTWHWRHRTVRPDSELREVTGVRFGATGLYPWHLATLPHLTMGPDDEQAYFRFFGDYMGHPAPGIFSRFFPMEWDTWPGLFLHAQIRSRLDSPWPLWALRAESNFADARMVWNRVVAGPIHEGLRRVRAGERVSFAPLFQPEPPPDEAPHLGAQTPYELSFLFQRESRLRSALQWEHAVLVNNAISSARFPLCITYGDQGEAALRGVLHLVGGVPEALDADRGHLTFYPQALQVAEAESATIYDGAVAMLVGGTLSEREGERAVLEAVLVDQVTTKPIHSWFAEVPPRSELTLRIRDLRIPLRQLLPAGQDLPPGEAERPLWSSDSTTANLPLRRPSILVPLHESTPRLPAGFALRVDERTGLYLSHSYALSIVSQTGNQAAPLFGSVLVLDPEPFSIAVIRPRPLPEPPAESDGVIARRESDGPWEFSGVSREFDCLMPPTALGEAMEKGTYLPERALIDFRLGAAAALVLRAAETPRRFIEAPWNLRRLFGWSGQREPGAVVENLDFELLYGLLCSVSKAGLRLAEVFAHGGSPVVPFFGPPRFAITREQHVILMRLQSEALALHRAYRQRLGAIELLDPTSAQPLHLIDGVSWKPRIRVADADGRRTGGAWLAMPMTRPSGSDPELEDVARRFHAGEDGLKGGFTWAFESPAIYKEFWRRSQSTSGELRQVFLSALGAAGYQIARFSRDKTVIQSRSGITGRTHFYALERFGRIGVFWHRAKHVIVFERSTAPSRQFRDEQNPHLGRPICRKVAEYVEILEPFRSTHDQPEAGATEPAFVTGCSFKDRVIPVSNAWSTDVEVQGTAITGWQIPLWQPGADPEVYRKPQVVLHLAADQSTGTPEVVAPISNPEVLHFYTDTRNTTDANVHAWEPIPGVDFIDTPDPLVPDNIPANGGLAGMQLPDPPLVPAGFERFTFAVEESAHEVNLMHSRSTEKSLNAVLRNVTAMRSTARAVQRPGDLEMGRKFDIAKRLIDVGSQMLNGFVYEVADIQRGANLSADELEARLTTRIRELLPNDAVQAAGAVIGSEPDYEQTFCTIPAGDSPGGVLHRRAWNEAARHANEFHARTGRTVQRLNNDLFQRIQTLAIPAQEWVTMLTREAESLRLRIRGEWTRFETGALNIWEQPGPALRAAIARLRTEIAALTETLLHFFRELEREAVIAQGRISTALQRVEEFEQRSTQVFAELAARAGRIAAVIGVPAATVTIWIDTVRARSARLAARVRAWLNDGGGVLARLPAMREDAEQLTVELLGSIEHLQGEIQTAADRAVADVRQRVLGVADTVEEVMLEVDSAIDRITREAAGWPEILARRLDLLRQALDRERQAITDRLKRTLCDVLRDPVWQLIAPLGHADAWVRDAKELFGNAAEFAQNFVRGLEPYQRLRALMSDLENRRAAVLSELRSLGESASNDFRRISGPVLEKVGKVLRAGNAASALGQEASRTFRTVCAFGEALKTPGMAFNRKNVAYLLTEGRKAIDMTPCIARMKEMGESLEALGIRLPTRSIAERLIPDALQNFDLSDIVSDIGGLRLTKLFAGLRVPPIGNDQIRVTHGVDPESLRAWAEASVALPISGRQTLLAAGPVTLTVVSPRLDALVSLEVMADGTRKNARGAIVADWELAIGGTEILTFVRTRLRFEGGKMHFELQPNQIRLSSLLRIISDYLPAGGEDEEGFNLTWLKVNGVPAGLKTTLVLPEIAAGGGTTSVTGLQLGAFFELRFLEGAEGALPRFDFSLGAGCNVGKPEKPFNLAIFILGGGGWIVTSLRYWPLKGESEVSVNIGVQASATLAFALGPLRGSVGIYLGIFAQFSQATGRPGMLSMGVSLLFAGHLSVLGIVEVWISLLLEAIYNTQTKVITGRGTIRVKVKICWCFKITVCRSITYTFGGAGRGGGNPAFTDTSDPYRARANDYVNSLE